MLSYFPRGIRFALCALVPYISDDEYNEDNNTSPVNVELVEWRRCVARVVSLEHGRRHRVPRDDLLVEHHRALERLPHVDVLE